MIRTECGGCGSSRLETILDLGTTPPANSFPLRAEAEERFPLLLGVCRQCWLVQQMYLRPDADLFGADYAFYSGTSPGLVAYHDQLGARLRADYQHPHRLTVEVGCNDGDLLRHLVDKGPVLGVDPAKGPALAARARGLNVIIEPFGIDLARRIRTTHGPAGLIIANHVAAHVIDLADLFGGFAELLDEEGSLVIEVQYLVDMLVSNSLDNVYHEHRYHWSIASLSTVAAQHGLFATSVAHLPDVQAGSVSVVFSRKPGAVVEGEDWLQDMAVYSDLQARADWIRLRLRDLLARAHKTYGLIAGYGAPAKAVTLLNFCDVGPDLVEYIADMTPAKAGRFLPGTGIPVVAMNGVQHPSVWLVLAHTYLRDIIRREWRFTSQGGQFIVPVPFPVML